MSNSRQNKSRASQWAARRWWIQTGFLAVWLGPLSLRLHSMCGPVFHCYSCPWATFACPIGVLANFSAIHTVPFIALGVLAIVGAVFGSFVCGWACPFGLLQDLIAEVPTPKVALPSWTSGFRYVVLIVFVLLIPYFGGEKHSLFFCRLCPAGALEGSVPSMVQQAAAGQPVVWPTTAKTAIVVVLLLAMFFTWRPWCTLFCPLGAIYGLCNQVSLMVLRFHPEKCVGCKSCRSLCRDTRHARHRADSSRCVHCLECTRCHALTVETVFSRREKTDAAES
jgi:ferredoxin-type protein NapH